MEMTTKSITLVFLTSLYGILRAIPITLKPTSASDQTRNPVPVEFVTLLAKSVADPHEDTGIFEMPDYPPDWLLHLITQVVRNEHRPVSNRQKRQLDLTDPAVQEILRAYYQYCMYKGCGGTMQVRLGRSIRTRNRRSIRGKAGTSFGTEEREIPEAGSRRHVDARIKRSARGSRLHHLLRHPSFAKFFKHRLHLRGRRSQSIRYNPKMMQILQIYYMRQRSHGTLHSRFG